MDYYRLGRLKWWQTQAYYHAMAESGREGLLICYPEQPYVCLGLHDDLEQEINLEYCRKQKLPLIRRETGGGVVYLDDRQIFFQLVLNRSNPILPLSRAKFYPRFLTPALRVCYSLGVRASLKEPADILIDGRKCSGNASGDIGEGVVYVGNLLINFDCEIMCNVLKTPTSLYRKCLQKAMDNNLTNLSEQVTSAQVSPEDLTSMLEKEFSGMFPLEPKCIDSELQQRAEIFLEKLTAPEWLKLEGKKRTCRKVKIAEGIYLAEHRGHNHESIMVLVKDGIITDLYALNDVKFKPYIGTQWTEDFLSLT